ncbi:Leukotoxin [Moraxella lacunata]|uniref:Leukotoxin n=1 Tax=Moraxella lacunata TaxID=477 RepID=A0A378QI00_MORLA|nr:calcium-binding protein [Moraxella lacunata]STZ00527.1 Leukotoxin [Moraxella lacunata]
MSNNQNQQTFTEKALELLQKHTIGGIKDGNTAFEDAWGIGFSNLSKITAQFAFEYDLQHFGDYERFSRFKDKLFDFSQLQTIAIHADRAKTHLEVLRNSSFTQHQEFKIIEQRLINTVLELNKGILEISNKNALNINVDSDSLSTILDKAYGNGYSQNFLKGLNKIFDYNQYIKLIYDTFNKDFKEVGDKSDYLQNLLGVIPKLAGSAFIDGKAGFVLGGEMSITRLATQPFVSHLEVVEKWASKLPTLSAKDFMGGLSRGLLVGILTDVTYKMSYAGAEKFLWGWLFEEIYGETAYEIYADEFEDLYSTIFQHLTADKLNAVIAFNTMILGNFVNEQGQSVITEDTAILFGSDDYKSMDFDKALKSYKKLYKAVSGKDDAKNITGAEELIRHMEGSYPLFKEYRGKLLNILQGLEDTEELFTLSQGDDETALAYRYALVNLNPFVLMDIDHTKHNPNGELDLYHAKTNPNGLTPIYLEKRAEMMSVMMDKMTGKFIQNKYNYQDLAENISVNETSLDGHHGNIDTYNDNTQVIFGGTGHDTIKAKDAGDNNNFLFGGAGHDIIIGGKGNDYLEGGQGYDTYHIKDHDTIFDADGKGHILFDNKPLPTDFILKQGASDIWEAKDSAGNVLYTAIREANDLVYQNIA